MGFEAPGGDDVGVAGVGRAEEVATAFAHETFEGGFRVVDERGDDVTGAGFAALERDEVAVENMRIDHRITADAEKPKMIRAGSPHAEERRIDGDGIVGRLLLHRGQASGDGAVDGGFEEMRLDTGRLEAPFTVGEFLELAFFRERSQVAHDGGLAGVELAANLTRRRRDTVHALVVFNEVENLVLAFGEHGRSIECHSFEW